jgi:hypothetical protein
MESFLVTRKFTIDYPVEGRRSEIEISSARLELSGEPKLD